MKHPAGDLGQVIRKHRLLNRLTLRELGARAGISASHLGRIEKGERFPSAPILQRIAKPLGFQECELLMLAGYLTYKSPVDNSGRFIYARQDGLDPYVAGALAKEPLHIQRAALGILLVLKSLSKTVSI